MVQGVNFGEMLNQSMTVLTKPSVESFEQFEKQGTMNDALTYVGAAAVLGAIVSLIFNLLGAVVGGGSFVGAILGLIGALILPIVLFFVFAFLLFTIGKNQGGTGTQDEVFYTTALYTAPILALNGVVGSIPFLGCLYAPVALLLALYQLYLAYLAVRASMTLEQNPAIITVVVAIVVQFIAGLILGAIFAAIGIGGAAAGGMLGM